MDVGSGSLNANFASRALLIQDGLLLGPFCDFRGVLGNDSPSAAYSWVEVLGLPIARDLAAVLRVVRSHTGLSALP